MRLSLPRLCIYAISLVFGILFAVRVDHASAATVSHLVISELQISTTSADFVELYNPTSSDINLNPFRLIDRNSTASTDASIVAFTASDIIPAHGYFLWCNTSLAVSLECDRNTGENLANNYSIGLRNGALNSGTLVDAVTVGTPAHSLGEGTSLAFSATQSFERKANSTSTSLSMAPGGSDEFMANAEDTDDNATDFVLRSIPQAQNSSALHEPVATSTPTAALTPTTVPTSTATPTTAPTVIPTETLTPTTIPSLTPSLTLSVTPSTVPSPSVTTAPTEALTPTATLTPQPFPNFHLVCTTKPLVIHILNFTISVPLVSCSLVRG